MNQSLGAARAFVIGVMVLGLAAAMEGCIILPIPTLEHGQGLSEGQVHERLAGSQFTRVDVLLTFGPPTWRKEQDRYFVYRWDRSHWSWVYILWLIFAVTGEGDAVYHPHRLAIEFNANGELRRYKYFARWIAPDDDEFFDEIFPEWVNEQRDDSP